MVEQYILYLGLNDRDTKTQKVTTLEAFKMVTSILKNYVEGATVFEADGIYTHNNGSIVIEKTLRIEILFFDDAEALIKAKAIVNKLKEALNQESVAVVHNVKVDSDLW